MADWRDILLVDGYNMIGGWPELAALSQTGMQGHATGCSICWPIIRHSPGCAS